MFLQSLIEIIQVITKKTCGQVQGRGTKRKRKEKIKRRNGAKAKSLSNLHFGDLNIETTTILRLLFVQGVVEQ